MNNSKNKTGFTKNILSFVDYANNTFTNNPLKYILLISLISVFTCIIHFMPVSNETTWVDANGEKHAEASTASQGRNIKNKGSYYASIVTFIILSCLYILKFVPSEYKRFVFMVSGIFASILALNYLLTETNIYNYNTGTTGKILLVLMCFILFLLLFRSIKRHITNIGGWSGFILNFIIYIPCLIDNFMEYIKDEFARTSNVTYILLGIEALLITAYILLPYVLSIPLRSNAFPIMNEANFLDMRNNFGERQIDFTVKRDVYDYDENNMESDLLYNVNKNKYETGKRIFTLSMWIYLNQQDKGTNPTKFFDYGGSHPSINYDGQENGKNKLKILLHKGGIPFELNIESQKWNNIIFNYNGNVVDIFINGHLVKSHTIPHACVEGHMTTTEDPVFSYGSVTPIDGAICNIKYYKKTLTKYQIVNIYNILKGQNPPINNIM